MVYSVLENEWESIKSDGIENGIGSADFSEPYFCVIMGSRQ